MQAVNFEEVRATRKQQPLSGSGMCYKTALITSPFDVVPGPEAFLIEGDPGSVSRAHFHIENQFQIVVAGEGFLGKHTVAPLTVHYSQRDVGYGPILAGGHGLAYMTLRPRRDRRSLHFPEWRHVQRPRLPARQHTVGPMLQGALADLRKLPGVRTEILIAPEDDGLAAWCLRVPPGMAAAAPEPVAGEGRYYMVVDGLLDADGQTYPRWSCIFCARGEAQPVLRAGPDGLILLALQFPDDPVTPDENRRVLRPRETQ